MKEKKKKKSGYIQQYARLYEGNKPCMKKANAIWKLRDDGPFCCPLKRV